MPLSPRAGAGLVAVGAEVQLTSDAALAFQLAKGHGGWASPMADCLGRCGVVVEIVNSQGDVRVNCGEFGSYVWNPAAIVGPAVQRAGPSVLALDLHTRRLFPSTTARGLCGLCRRSLGGAEAGAPADGAEASAAAGSAGAGGSTAASVGEAFLFTIGASASAAPTTEQAPQEEAKTVAFCSRDGAFRLCHDCAEPYLDPTPTGDDGQGPLDCPDRHGLSDITTHGSARCDLCRRTLDFSEVLRGCRTCDWGVCPDCLKNAPQGSRAPRLDVGARCHAEWPGKNVRAVVVDVRDGPDGGEVLLHCPGQSAEADEWIKVTSTRIVPVDPPAANLRFHPSHCCGLTPARLPRFSSAADRAPKCTAEVKFPGGCRRFWAQDRPAPDPAVGLYCERCEFFLCPWCVEDDVISGVGAVAGMEAASRADVQALWDPQRRSDAALRIAKQCSRSFPALASLMQAGAVGALAEALGGESGEAMPRTMLALLLDLAEWLFDDPPLPTVGDRVLCERAAGAWHVASVVQVDVGPEASHIVEWADGGDAASGPRTTVRRGQLRRLLGAALAGAAPTGPAARRRPALRHGVPPPETLTRDFLMKKAIPSDNTAQARQYLMDGADLNALSEAGDGALVLAVEHGCKPQMVKLLLEFGCPLTPGATLGEPLELAARYGQSETIELLLDRRADPRTLRPEGLPEHSRARVAPLAALLSIGGAGDDAAKNACVPLADEKASLASHALPPLARLLAARSAGEVLEESAEAEARILRVLDRLLGAHGAVGADGCLADLAELLQRLMTTYSVSAGKGALLLVRRLLAMGPLARAELQRCGAQRFVSRLAAAATGSPSAALPSSLPRCIAGTGTALRPERGGLEVAVLAKEVLKDMDACMGPTDLALAGSASGNRLAEAASALQQLAALAATPGSVNADEAGAALGDLRAVLAGAPGSGAAAWDMEERGVPQALVALLDAGLVTGRGLAEQLGEGCSALATVLLRLVEMTEALQVQPLPVYLSQAPGLRVLCEPLVVVLQATPQGQRAHSLLPHRPQELAMHWLQVEPLLRLRELERTALLTTSILDKDFLAWCLGLVGKDVAPREAAPTLPSGPSASASTAAPGHVLSFRLATALRIPVHTVKRHSDGLEVDLIASVHGLAAVGPPTAPPEDLASQVELLRLEAATSPSDWGPALEAIRAALQAKRAVLVSAEEAAGAGLSAAIPAVPVAAQGLLEALGFEAVSGADGVWECREAATASAAFEELMVLREGSGTRKAASSGVLEPDPEMVSRLTQVFSENGAKRACAAVENSSVEEAMEWAVQHMGDPDFNEPFTGPAPGSRAGLGADPRAPVWSVFIMLPADVPFDLVWPMLEDPVKGALTSVANAWTAMGWAGGEAEMTKTIREQVALAGEGPIARGLVRAKAERVASRLGSHCECRVEADPEGASHAPRGRAAGAGGSSALLPGTRVHLVLEAEKCGFVAAVSEAGDGVDVVTDDGRLLSSLPNDQVRPATRQAPGAQPAAAASERARAGGLAGSLQALMQGAAQDAGLASALASVAEPICAPSPTPLQCTFEALDRGAQESDVVRRFQPQDLLGPAAGEGGEGGPAEGASPPSLQPAPTCRMAFSLLDPRDAGVDCGGLCLLRGERSWISSKTAHSFSSTSWLTVGVPGLAVAVGSWYYEVELSKIKNPQVGWADAKFRFLVGAYSDDGVGDDAGSWAADGERRCLWHRGREGSWRSAGSGQTIGCAVAIDTGGQAQMWFAVDGVWDEEPSFASATPDTYLYPAISGELEAQFHFDAAEMVHPPPSGAFRPIGEVLAAEPSRQTQKQAPLLLPPTWTVLQGLGRLSGQSLAEAPTPFVLQATVHVEPAAVTARKQAFAEVLAAPADGDNKEVDGSNNDDCSAVTLRHSALEQGLPLELTNEESGRALSACGIVSPAARAALRLLQELQQAVPAVAGAGVAGSPWPGCSRRLGAKLGSHLEHPLAGCAGAYPRWCRELPILAPWLFPLEAREALMRCSAFGVTFAVRWLQERAVDERFAERRRAAEERLAQAKHIGDAALLNSAYESLFELQGQIARDSEAWVGSLKSELVRVEREKVLQQAERAMELTRASPCSLEVQFEGESGFGRAVTQGFYTLVAHELQRRAENREVPMWVEDDPPLNEDFLRPRHGLLVRPLPLDSQVLPEVERRFCMLGRLMAKALREGFVVPLPLTATFFQLMLGGAVDPAAALPRPGDGVAGEFVGACTQLVADAARGPAGLAELAADPEWSRKYMQPPGEEAVPPAPFAAFAGSAAFVETGLGGAALCPGGEHRQLDVDNVAEFVQLASAFWLDSGITRQMVAFRRGLYDVLGAGAVALWAFGPGELRRLFCGEDEVVWTEKELAEHLQCGGGYSAKSEQVRWLREEMLAMAPPLRAKFLEFVTSCPRLPPGGLKELQLSVHPDPADGAGLPRSRACAHRLFLPRYASREELARQLQEAILSSGGHHEQELPP